MPRPIRLVVADDQALVREGLVNMLKLNADLSVVGEAAGGEEAIALVSTLKPDVFLLDYRMPPPDGLSVLRQLALSGQLPPTLILTTFEDEHLLVSSMNLGARGFLLKDASLQVLIQAIFTVADGGRWLHTPQYTGVARPDHLSSEATLGLEPLTEREQEVLRLMTLGLSNREIAGALQTTEGTVKGYVSNVLSKLGVRDRTRAVLKALNARMV